jgi:hypothetical protein
MKNTTGDYIKMAEVKKTDNFLWRYTDLTSLIYLLTKKKITLLDPESWDDSNDSHYLSVYKRRKNLKSLLALCVTQVPETYHHWRVFAEGNSGVCIKFKRVEFLQSVERIKGVKHDEVQYFTINQLEKKKPKTDQLPFIKRFAFEDECEYRVIFESKNSDFKSKNITIPLSCISRITLSPWANRNVLNQVVELLNNIDGCEKIEIKKSTIVNNAKWKRLGGYLRGKIKQE